MWNPQVQDEELKRFARAKTPRPLRAFSAIKPHRVGCNCQACQNLSQPSEFVRWTQHRLNELMGLRLTVNGLMNPATRSAIRGFQERQGIAPDGLVGPPTRRALEGTTSETTQSELGETPSWLQQTLNAASSASNSSLSNSSLLNSSLSNSSTAPRLIGKEQSPQGLTLYLEIDLGIQGVSRKNAQPITGVFIPAGFRSSDLNLILYLHGVKVKPDLSIREYWSAYPHFALREALAASGRQAILVAPTLGPLSQYQVGSLIEKGGLDKYLAQVMAGLKAYGDFNQPLANIVLACHSGGGFPMREMAMARNQSSRLIRECWGFDCTYYKGDPNWLHWAKANPQSRLYLYYIPNSKTEPRALFLANKQPNLIVQKANTRALKVLYPNTVAHNLVPLSHWTERLNEANFLTQGTGAPRVPVQPKITQPSPTKPSNPVSSDFVLVPLESPGGGRVQNKTDPKSADIVSVPRAFGRRKIPLHRVAARAWQALVDAARKDGLEHPLLLPTSGYRSFAEQQRLWKAGLDKRQGSVEEARKWVAPPGHSAHQSGRAIDFWLGTASGSKNIVRQRNTRAYKWMVQNANRFGFYPYEREPWHWEYNPPAQSQELEDSEVWEMETPHRAGCSCQECQLETGTDQEFSDIFQLPGQVVQAASSAVNWLTSNSSLNQNMVSIALQEWQRWGQGSIQESDPAIRSVLLDYWLTGANVHRGGKKWWSAHPWSAAFISWVIKKAGAGKSFRYSAAHSYYIAWAKQNRLSNNSSPFKAYRLNEAKPRPGDLVCKSRAGSGATYDTIKPGMKTHCDIVIQVHPDHLVTIGGNVKQSVHATQVKLDANGYVNQAGYFAVIRVDALSAKAVSPNQPRASSSTGGASSTTQPSTSKLPNGYHWIPKVIPLLERYRQDLPLEFLLGWIQIESGGKNATVTNLDERGYFQVHPDESKDYGFTDHQRISRDADYSVQVGIELVRRKAKRAKLLGFRPGTDLFNHAIKLLHWAPAGVKAILQRMKADGFAFADKSWSEFKEYVQNHHLEIQILTKKLSGKNLSPIRGIANVDKLFAQADKIRGFLKP